MKTDLKDFLYSGLVMAILAFISALGTYLVSLVISRPLLGLYAPVFNVAVFLFLYGISSAVFIRIMLHFKPFLGGKYEMESDAFRRWKLYIVIYEFGRKAIAPFIVVILKTPFEKLFGAKVGKNVVVSGTLVDSHMITLEDNVIVGQQSLVSSHYLNNGRIVLQPTILKKNSTVGIGAVVLCSEVGENSVVMPGTFIPPGTVIPPNELWGGFPAQKIKDIK